MNSIACFQNKDNADNKIIALSKNTILKNLLLYTGKGMDEMECTEAECKRNYLTLRPNTNNTRMQLVSSIAKMKRKSNWKLEYGIRQYHISFRR